VFLTVLGLVGLVLPIIPGMLFLLLAALMASRHSPTLARFLDSNRYTARMRHFGSGFSKQTIWGKVRLCFWGTLKVTLNGIHSAINAIRKVLRLN
jgi:uncharacterized membrane protein YbaN (DUF454 family)